MGCHAPRAAPPRFPPGGCGADLAVRGARVQRGGRGEADGGAARRSTRQRGVGRKCIAEISTFAPAGSSGSDSGKESMSGLFKFKKISSFLTKIII